MTKVLVIRFSSIGDIVLISPVLRNLKKQMHDGVEIHILTKESFRSLTSGNPHVAKVYSFEKSTNEVMEDLLKEEYHYIIDLQGNLRSARVKRKLKELSFTLKKYNFEKWLLVNLGIDKLPKVHVVDRYMDTLKAFGIQNDNKGLDFFFDTENSLDTPPVPPSHESGFIAVGIGAAHWRKKPKKEQYIKLCHDLNYPVVLIGGKTEEDLGSEIVAASSATVWNTAGKLSLSGSALLLKRSRLVISPDTGIMHIAAAFKKPIISLWGATVPNFGMYPYQNENLSEMVQADHLPKRPCSKLGTKCKYKPCRCIDELPLEKAVYAASKFLKHSLPSQELQ